MQAGGSLPSVNRLLAEPESGIFHSMIVCPNAPQLTVEDYRSLPEAGPRYQLIGGDLYMAPAPNRFHQEISRNLQVKLFLYLRATGAGKIFNSPFDVYLDETNVFQPDLIVVLNDRLGILTEAGAEGAPNLVIEILSPKTRRLDLEQKRKAYPRFGVQELWIIDPDPRLTTQHRFCADGSVITVAISESDSLSSPLLPGFVISGTELYER
jgi:Uma2 family endonuclease